MEYELNNTPVEKGNSDILQVLKVTFWYFLFILIFVGIKLVGNPG
jgi:hypothetical protein